MDLVAPLAAGVNGAQSGTAQVRIRGIDTRATWFSDFEGQNAVSTGDDIPLSANGVAEVYVDRFVDVLVFDSSGVQVSAFTNAVSSEAVEHIGPSFTGTSYDGQDSGVNQPTTEADIFDLWVTQNGAGATNWRVLLGGTVQTLPTALSPLVDLVFNVKGPPFNAAGNGTADDTSAIQSAINAAAAAGGGNVFLPGTGSYSITSQLTLTGGVNLVGAGPESSIIKMDNATAAMILCTSTAHGHQIIRDVQLTAGEPNTGVVLTVPNGSDVLVDNCYIGGSDNNAVKLVASTGASSQVVIRDCVFEMGASATDAIDCDTITSGRWKIDKCRFITPAAYTPNSGLIYGRHVDITDCDFDLALSTTGTFVCYQASSSTLDATVSGCRFRASGGATVTGMTLGAYLAASRFVEVGNVFTDDSNFTAYSYVFVGAQKGAVVQLITREGRVQAVSSNAATLELATDQYGLIVLTRTNTDAQTVNPVIAPEGARGRWLIVTTGNTSETLGTLFVNRTALNSIVGAITSGITYQSTVIASTAQLYCDDPSSDWS